MSTKYWNSNTYKNEHFVYWHCPLWTVSVYVTVRRPSVYVCNPVPSINSSIDAQWVCRGPGAGGIDWSISVAGAMECSSKRAASYAVIRGTRINTNMHRHNYYSLNCTFFKSGWQNSSHARRSYFEQLDWGSRIQSSSTCSRAYA